MQFPKKNVKKMNISKTVRNTARYCKIKVLSMLTVAFLNTGRPTFGIFTSDTRLLLAKSQK